MKLAEVHMVRGLKEYISSMCDPKNDAQCNFLFSLSRIFDFQFHLGCSVALCPSFSTWPKKQPKKGAH